MSPYGGYDVQGSAFNDRYCVHGRTDDAERGSTEADEPAASIDANFNGVVNADGSFVGLWRTWSCTRDLCPPHYAVLGAAKGLHDDAACFSVVHAITGPDWKNPSSYRTQMRSGGPAAFPLAKNQLKWLFEGEYTAQQATRGIEDPMVYVDRHGTYHAIFHDMFERCDPAVEGSGCHAPRDTVTHAYSVDGTSWTSTGSTLRLTNNHFNFVPRVSFTDGDTSGLDCERPQLIVRDGVPTHMIIGGIPEALGVDTGQLQSVDWPGGATMVIPLV